MSRLTRSQSSCSQFECPICDELVKDASGSKLGQDSIWCDGPCASWLHRRCAGLSIQKFGVVAKSKDKFHCPTCRLCISEKELSKLKETVNDLVKRIESLESSQHTQSLQVAWPKPLSVEQGDSPYFQSGQGDDSSLKNMLDPNKRIIHSEDRKYNVVLFGVEECEKGVSRFSRQCADLEKVSSVLTSLDDPIPSTSIKDQFRLGKYSEQSSRPRPILVKFVRSSDAFRVLSKSRSLKKPFHVKPDLSPSQRVRDSVLLKERWSLITNGVPRASIKIRGSKLYVNQVLHGSLDSSNVFNHAHSVEVCEPVISQDTMIPDESLVSETRSFSNSVQSIPDNAASILHSPNSEVSQDS